MRSYRLPTVAGFLMVLTNLILGFIEILIGLRIILKLFGANASVPFVNWVYETSQPLLAPFLGIFPSPVINGSFLIEFSAIFALIVYALLAYLIHWAIRALSPRMDVRDTDVRDDVE